MFLYINELTNTLCFHAFTSYGFLHYTYATAAEKGSKRIMVVSGVMICQGQKRYPPVN